RSLRREPRRRRGRRVAAARRPDARVVRGHRASRRAKTDGPRALERRDRRVGSFRLGAGTRLDTRMSVAPGAPSGTPGPGLFALPPFNASASRGFVDWLAEQRVSLAMTLGDHLALVGHDGDELRVETRQFGGAAAVAVVGSGTLYVSAGWQLWRLEDALAEGT